MDKKAVSGTIGIRDALAQTMREPLVYNIIKRNGMTVALEHKKVTATFKRLAQGFEADVSLEALLKEMLKNIYDGISTNELERAMIMSAVTFIERDPAYGVVASRLLRQRMLKEMSGTSFTSVDIDVRYRQLFKKSIMLGVEHDIFTQKLLSFDIDFLADRLEPSRDEYINYMGLQTLYQRYVAKINDRRIESPQAFWMRVAMGLALNEKDKNAKAVEFYTVMSNLWYVPSTPTLFHSGFPVPQLSSCFVNTVNDDLHHIFKCVGDNAQIAKWAGGIGTDWTPIRATGAYIRKIKATSQGVIPYLKIANDVVVAITKSGIRRGGSCVYLETWHYDIEDFLDLRRNTGDERRRTHDMNTAHWIPDLFMQRVQEDAEWTLFSPDEALELHDLYGKAFAQRYVEYEQAARDGKMKLYKIISAKQLWRKMLTRLFETGHPWITFKDPCNVRSPQDHVGVIHSSNLCTEIVLNTSADETAVCNLGSLNIARLISQDGGLHEQRLESTVKTALRMLDNVIDLSFYPTKEARMANMHHRPVGLGLMGLQDLLFKLDIPFASKEAKELSDVLMEKISYYAIEASCLLAQERGPYSTFKGSKWERGIFPIDTVELLERERGMSIDVSRVTRLNWVSLKKRVKKFGMRHSNVLAIAPTATISTISGSYPCIEPQYENIYVESNITGEFTIVNNYLVADLKKLGLWSQDMLDQIKYFDGNLNKINEIPQALKDKYQTVFDIDPRVIIDLAAERGKWIDQSQSLNIFLQGVSGSRLHEIYTYAWHKGLKTTYYLRTLGASQIEKSTLDAQKFGFTQKRSDNGIAKSCPINRSFNKVDRTIDCESCQ